MTNELKTALRQYWQAKEGYSGPIEITETEDEIGSDESSLRRFFAIETEGNDFEAQVCDDGTVFLTARGLDKWHTLTDIPCVILNRLPYIPPFLG